MTYTYAEKMARYAELPQEVVYEPVVETRKLSFFPKLLEIISSFRGYIFSFLTALFFSLSNIFIKKASLLNGSDHLVILFIVNMILMIIVIASNRINIFGPVGIRFLLVVRGLGGLFAMVSLYIGLVLIPPSDCSAISHTSLIITAILARILLNEKLGIVHLISLLLTIIGVVFISKPSVLFPQKRIEIVSNDAISAVNSTLSALAAGQFSNLISVVNKNKFTIGVAGMLISAFLFGVLQIIIKKLCNHRVHWAVNTIYIGYFGLPICILSSVLLVTLGFDHKNMPKSDLSAFPIHIAFSALSATLGVLGQCSMNIALQYEDVTKVAILKAIDVFISFILQLIILNVQVDVLSVVGSLTILLGTFLVLAFKMIEARYEKKKGKKSAVSRLVFFKF